MCPAFYCTVFILQELGNAVVCHTNVSFVKPLMNQCMYVCMYVCMCDIQVTFLFFFDEMHPVTRHN